MDEMQRWNNLNDSKIANEGKVYTENLEGVGKRNLWLYGQIKKNMTNNILASIKRHNEAEDDVTIDL